MKISFLNNGIDSLQKGFKNLYKYEEEFYSPENSLTDEDRFYLLKDCILFVHHGIEALFKHVLYEESSYLIFSDLNRSVKDAFVEKRNNKLDSVFATQLSHKIHTVGFDEAVERVVSICNYDLSQKLNNKLTKLQNLRNQIMHSEIYFNENEINKLFEGLLEELDSYFQNSIGDEYKTINGYSQLVENYKTYEKILEDKKLEDKKKILECFLDIFEEIGFGMGLNEVKLLTNINIVTKILNSIIDSGFKLGMDLYNGACSGNISNIKRIDDSHFKIITEDDNSQYIFKFKSFLIFMPSFESRYSPILYLESDNDLVSDYPEEKIRCHRDKIEFIEGIYLEDEEKTIFNPKEVDKFYGDFSKDYTTVQEFSDINKFLTKGIFCFINFMALNYEAVSLLDWWEKDLKELEVYYRSKI